MTEKGPFRKGSPFFTPPVRRQFPESYRNRDARTRSIISLFLRLSGNSMKGEPHSCSERKIFTHGTLTPHNPNPPAPLAILATVVVNVVVAAGALYWAQSEVFVPLYRLPIFLAFIMSPAVAILQRRGLGRVPSIILIVGSAVVIAAGVGLVVGTQFVHLTKTLPDHEDKIKAKDTTVKPFDLFRREQPIVQLS